MPPASHPRHQPHQYQNLVVWLSKVGGGGCGWGSSLGTGNPHTLAERRGERPIGGAQRIPARDVGFNFCRVSFHVERLLRNQPVCVERGPFGPHGFKRSLGCELVANTHRKLLRDGKQNSLG